MARRADIGINMMTHLAATATIAEKDKDDAIDEDPERRRTLLGDIEAVTGTEAAIRTEKGGVTNIGAEAATVKEDLGVRRKKGRVVGAHGTIALARTTPSATAAH